MTAVAVPVTDAPASRQSAVTPVAPVQGFALWVSTGQADADPGALASLAAAVVHLINELAPGASVHAVLGGAAPDRDSLPVGEVRDELAERRSAADGSRLKVAGPADAGAEHVGRASGARCAVVVDTDAHELSVGGRRVPLTYREFALLAYLLRAPHRAVGREELLRTVWRDHMPGERTRTIDVHVRRLREKLGSSLQIVTVRGVGYRCDPTPETVLVSSGDAD